MPHIPINEIDVDRIPYSGLDRYTHEELLTIARFALQRLDMMLMRDRWKLVDNKQATKKELMRLIRRFQEYGTKS